MSKYGVFSGPNTRKYGPEKTVYLDTFHAVIGIFLTFAWHVKIGYNYYRLLLIFVINRKSQYGMKICKMSCDKCHNKH